MAFADPFSSCCGAGAIAWVSSPISMKNTIIAERMPPKNYANINVNPYSFLLSNGLSLRSIYAIVIAGL